MVKETIFERHDALPIGTMLHGHEITEVLDAGSFGIAYKVLHLETGLTRVIKEFMPDSTAVRLQDTCSIAPKSNSVQEVFEWGINSFIEEAQLLMSLSHPNIVPVIEAFKKFGTAYFVMPFISGQTLSSWIYSNSSPTQEQLENIFISLLEGLKYLHQKGYLHRDIKPDNVIISNEGVPILIDFGAARQSTARKSQVLTQVLTPHYAAIEQYSSTGPFTPALDLYGLAACMYHAISQTLPVEAPDRVSDDFYRPLHSMSLQQPYQHNFLKTVDKNLSLFAKNRSKDGMEFQLELMGIKEVEISVDNASTSEQLANDGMNTIMALIAYAGKDSVITLHEQDGIYEEASELGIKHEYVKEEIEKQAAEKGWEVEFKNDDEPFELLSSGAVVKNRYEIIKVLGKGQLGISYHAKDLNNIDADFDEVFIRVFQPEPSFSSDCLSEERENFKRQATVLKNVKSPGVEKFIDSFQLNGELYYVTEFIKGQSLSEMIQKYGENGLSEGMIEQCFLPVLDALDAFHKAGFVYLNLCLDDIIFDEKRQRPVLIDMAASQLIGSKPKLARSPYSPIEQYDTLGKVTGATDLYAFGIALFMLMNPKGGKKIPRTIDSFDNSILEDLLSKQHLSDSGYPDYMYALIEQCTYVHQKDRPDSVQKLKSTLSRKGFEFPTKKSHQNNKHATNQSVNTTTSGQMSFFDWYLVPLKKYFDFKGRASRKEYWTFVLINQLFYTSFSLLTYYVEHSLGIVNLIGLIVLVIPSLAVFVRRLHDTGRSGWLFLLVLIPVIGGLISLYFLLQKGKPETNEYGSDPLK